jgi:hypothetical protein
LEKEQINATTINFRIIGVTTQLIPFYWENKMYPTTNVDISNSGYGVVEPIEFVTSLFRED